MERPRSGTKRMPRSSTPTSRPPRRSDRTRNRAEPSSPLTSAPRIVSEPNAYRARNRKFESVSLQRRVSCELAPPCFRAPPFTRFHAAVGFNLTTLVDGLNRTRRSAVAEIHQKSVAADRPPDRGVKRTVCRLQRKHHPRHQHCRCQHGGDSPQSGSNCSLGGCASVANAQPLVSLRC
jgi:hypothetical protein